MGLNDRMIRLLVATGLIILAAMNVIHGTFAIIALVVAGIFLLTSFLGRCPLYNLFGINTRPKKV